MKFAFSTSGCPKWDFATIAARATEYGYAGVEIRGFLGEPGMTGEDIFSDPEKVRGIFSAAGIQIACLSSSIAMQQDRTKDAAQAANVLRYLDLASRLGCPLVKICDTQVKPGDNRAAVGRALANWLAPLADAAADRGVVIVVENALSFRTAKEMWTILESLNHPSIGICWDLFSAVQAGEMPAISVPMLNSRIQYAQVCDAMITETGAAFSTVGEGSIPIQKFLTRLQGIGYIGWVTMEWEKAWLAKLPEPEEILPPAIAKLKQWTHPASKPRKHAHPVKH